MLQIVIVDAKADQYKEHLEACFPGQVTVHAAKDEAEAMAYADCAEVLGCFPNVSNKFVEKACNLKWVQAMTTGIDHVLAYDSLSDDVMITSTRGIHGPQMSEVAIMHMLALNRKLAENVRNQAKHAWERWATRLLWKKSVGIVGMGTSGHALAERLRPFGMKIHAIVQTPRPIPEVDEVHNVDDLAKVAPLLDYIVLLSPLNEKSRHLINAKVLAAMKPDAMLINLARGALVDQEALIKALKEKRIGGAGLDALDPEPLPGDSPLWDMDNVLITPHIAGMSDTYPHQALAIVEENVRQYLAGKQDKMCNLIRGSSCGCGK